MAFDPYHKWLGIPKDQRPPTFYQLLGIASGEDDAEVIDEAAVRQTTHVRAYQIGPHAEVCTRLLNEIASARQTLLNPAKRKAYNEKLAQQGKLATGKTATEAGITERPAAAPKNVFEELAGDEPDDVPIRIRRDPKPAAAGSQRAWILPAAIGGGVAMLLSLAASLFLLMRTPNPPIIVEAIKPVERKGVVPEPPVVPDPPEVPKPPVNPQPMPGAVPPRPPLPIRPAPQPVQPLLPIDPAVRDARLRVAVPDEMRRFPMAQPLTALAWLQGPDQVLLGGATLQLFDMGKNARVRTFGSAPTNPHMNLVVAPDGETIYVLRANEAIAVHHVNNAGYTRLPQRAAGTELALSRDGKLLLFTREDGLISIWDLEKRAERGTIEPIDIRTNQRLEVKALAIAPSGKYIGSGHSHHAMFWETASRTLKLSRHYLPGVVDVAFHPISGEAVAALTNNLSVYSNEVELKRGVIAFFDHIAFTPDGQHLVGLGLGKGGVLTVMSWPELRPVRTYEGRYGAFAIAPDSRSLVAYEIEGVLRQLALPGGALAAAPRPPDPVKVVRRAPPAENERQEAERRLRERFAKEYSDKAGGPALAEMLLKLAEDTTTGDTERFVLLTEARQLAVQAGRVSMAVDAIEQLASQFAVDPLALKLTSLEGISKATLAKEAVKELGDAAVTAAAEAAAADQPELTPRFVSIARIAAKNPALDADETRKLAERIKAFDDAASPVGGKDRLAVLRNFRAHASAVGALIPAPDGKKLLSGGHDGFIYGWELPSLRRTFNRPNGLAVHSLALSPDQAYLAACSEDQIRIFDLRLPAARPRQMDTVPGAFWQDEDTLYRVVGTTFWSHEVKSRSGGGSQVSTGKVMRTVASPNRKMVAVLGVPEVVLISMERGFAGPRVSLRSEEATAAAFSPDNAVLALADKDGTVRIYDVASRQEKKALIGHKDTVRALAFASANRLLSGGDDRTVRLWDAASGKQLGRGGHNGPVLAICIMPDGRRVYSGGGDSYIREWGLTAEGK